MYDAFNSDLETTNADQAMPEDSSSRTAGDMKRMQKLKILNRIVEDSGGTHDLEVNFNKIDSFGKEDTYDADLTTTTILPTSSRIRKREPSALAASVPRPAGLAQVCNSVVEPDVHRLSADIPVIQTSSVSEWRSGCQCSKRRSELRVTATEPDCFKPSLKLMPSAKQEDAGLRPGHPGLRPSGSGLRPVEDLETRRMFLGSPNSDQTPSGLHFAVVSGPRSGRASPEGLCAGDIRDQEILGLEAEDQSATGKTTETVTVHERYLVSCMRTRIFVFDSKKKRPSAREKKPKRKNVLD